MHPRAQHLCFVWRLISHECWYTRLLTPPPRYPIFAAYSRRICRDANTAPSAMASGTPSAKAPDEEAPDQEASDEVEPTSPTVIGGDHQSTRRRRRFAGALGGGRGSSSGGRHSYLRQLRDNLRKPV